MSSPTIYKSSFPDIDLGQPGGLFTYTFNNEHLYDADAPAFIDALTGEQLTRKQLKDACLRFAYAVKQRGVKRGEVAMVFSPNTIGFPIALLGLAAAGVKATLANSSYVPAELLHQLKDSGAGLIFVHPALLPVLLQALKLLGVESPQDLYKRVFILSSTQFEKKLEKDLKVDAGFTRLEAFLAEGKLEKEEMFPGDQAKETMMLCYSSGTTGLSKGVETTHENLSTVTTLFPIIYEKTDPKTDVALSVLPFFHIYVSMVLLFHLRLGIPQVVMSKFDPELFCSTIEKYKITLAGIVPPILVVLINHPATAKYNMKTLRMLSSGAAPLGPDLVKRVKDKFAKLGNPNLIVTQGYGLTETSPATHFLPGKDSIARAGTIGILVPNIEARLVGDDGRDVKTAPENPGELWIRGKLVMKGYLNNPKATADAITPDGWFKTGDMAIRDNEGFFTIVDRKKELIKYKGFQVPPADLEGVLLSHEQIADVGVIGVWSAEHATEFPRAYVVSTNNAALLADPTAKAAFEKSIQEWIKTKVANHKYLRGGVHVVPAIPKSGTGKILRKDLRALAAKEAKEGKAKL